MNTPLFRSILAFSLGAAFTATAQAEIFRPNTARDLLLGAAAGAVIGHQSGRTAEGAIIGATVGALVSEAVREANRPSQCTTYVQNGVTYSSPTVIADAPTVGYAPQERVVYVQQPTQVVYVPTPQVVYYSEPTVIYSRPHYYRPYYAPVRFYISDHRRHDDYHDGHRHGDRRH
jgi:hypothetical protein